MAVKFSGGIAGAFLWAMSALVLAGFPTTTTRVSLPFPTLLRAFP